MDTIWDGIQRVLELGSQQQYSTSALSIQRTRGKFTENQGKKSR